LLAQLLFTLCDVLFIRITLFVRGLFTVRFVMS
jgi:hypothetical protein